MKETNNPFGNMFSSIAKIIDDFEHKPKYDNDINISNWITEVLSNEDFEHVVDISGKIKGNDFDYSTLAKFNPATMKGNANAYQESMRLDRFIKKENKEDKEFTLEEYLDSFQTLFAYVVGWMILGKPISAVNMARGQIYLYIVDKLKITDLTVVIHDVSLGGSKPKINLDFNQNEVTKLAEYHVERGKRILSREDNASNKAKHYNAVTQNASVARKPIKL